MDADTAADARAKWFYAATARAFLRAARYCDGNSFSGNRDEPVMHNGKPLYFRGRRIIDTVLSYVTGQCVCARVLRSSVIALLAYSAVHACVPG